VKIPALLKFIVVVVVAFLIFSTPGYISGKPIPASLVSLYMFFVIVTLLLAMTATDEGAGKLFGPIKKILLAKRYRPLAFVLLLIAPCLFAYKTYSYITVGLRAPAEQRIIHPTPPRRLSAYGKKYNLSTLKNPYRKIEGSGKEFRGLVKEGGVIYYRNCLGCHGAQLSGRGHLAGGLNPAPLPFTGSDTIAQLNEAYLFWRIVKGGPGLPVSARPRMTAMPAWEGHLNEADIWKVILFLYDYTGNTPRSWKGKETRARISPTGRRSRKRDRALEGLTPIERGKGLYANYCWWCHGEDGYGDGPAATRPATIRPAVLAGRQSSISSSEVSLMMPPPRDLTDGTYKFKTTPFDEFYPSDSDIVRAIKEGLSGTAMPAWEGVLTDGEIEDLAAYLKDLGAMEPPEKNSIDYGKAEASGKESVATGRELFKDRCTECHGDKGRGNPSKSLKDDWGFRTWPGNFTRLGGLKRSNSAKEVYARITTGIAGTQMPSFADPDNKKGLTTKERWDVASYVMSLKADYKRADGGNLIRAVRSEAPLSSDALPGSPEDSLWDKASFKTFLLSPAFRGEGSLKTPTLVSVSIKALYSDKGLALLVEWDDPTASIPGLNEARKIIGAEPLPDTLEVRLSSGLDESLDAEALAKAELRRHPDFEGAGLLGWKSSKKGSEAIYEDGTWRVVVRRSFDSEGANPEGLTLPVAFALRDGSNMEQGRKYSTTGWLWLAFEDDKGAGGYLWPVVVFLATFILELIWLKGAARSEDGH